ncbi:unnamed protein product [Rotaria magnacalcarata]|uniref:Uncharacterized protein n=1 Tax=Rotaria magnacalcarata TaxID=392030 RepID=A0A815U5J8_9BILA|nr:unnamed protein product [Rotaria magnacalcarata]
MAMANYRGRCRYHHLVTQYYEIFEFTESRQPITISFSPNDQMEIPKKLKYYDVKLKDCGKDLTLKKVFEILQVYNSIPPENLTASKERSYIDGTMPLLLDLHIGGTDHKFLLSKDVHKNLEECQVQVSMVKDDKTFVGSGYPYWIGKVGTTDGFSNQSPSAQGEIARSCMNCLKSSIRDQAGKLKCYDKLEHVVEFLATTQIVESIHGNQNYANARTVGMNKLARSLLSSIENGRVTFRNTFDCYSFGDDSYPPIGEEGPSRARNAVWNVTRCGARCDDMSDDSDSDDGEYGII